MRIRGTLTQPTSADAEQFGGPNAATLPGRVSGGAGKRLARGPTWKPGRAGVSGDVGGGVGGDISDASWHW